MEPRCTPSGQPCWTCKKACGGCSWSGVGPDGRPKFEPVKGWKARKIRKHDNGNVVMETYKILFCPEYEEEEPRDEYVALEPKVRGLTKGGLTNRQIALLLGITMADVRTVQGRLKAEGLL